MFKGKKEDSKTPKAAQNDAAAAGDAAATPAAQASDININALFAAFAEQDPKNTNTVDFKKFNSLSETLGFSGEGTSDKYDDELVTFAETCEAAGVIPPPLPLAINAVAECYRKVQAEGDGAVNLGAFAKKLKMYIDFDVNPEDVEVSFNDALTKISQSDKVPLKFNVLKDAIRRWGKEGNGDMKAAEVLQFARFYQINPADVESNLDVLGLAELLQLKAFKLPEDHPVVVSGVPMNDVRKAFDWGDADHNGILSADELGRTLRLAGQNPSQSEIKKQVAEVQERRGGVYDFDAFVEMCVESYIPLEDQITRAKEAFSVFDEDNSGTISLTELKRIMTTYGEDMSEDEVQELFETLDTDNDGNLNIDEFVELLVS